MSEKVKDLIAAELDEIIAIRHDLHAHPQPSFQETHAAEVVRRELAAAGIEFQPDVAKTGVVGWLLPSDPSVAARKAVALRADMDALSVTEATDVAYASKNPGFMHACGHDGHMAILIGAARVLSKLRGELPRPVKFFFQPAEEGGGGARKLIEQGAMGTGIGGCEVGAVFGLHEYPTVALGKLGFLAGPVKASVTWLRLTITGRGGHGACPHQTADPIIAAAHVVTAIQTIVSRNVTPTSPAVVTVGSFHAGKASNVIPPEATLAGTIRTYDDETLDLIESRLRQLTTDVAGGFGCQAKVETQRGYPVTRNDPAATEYMKTVATDSFGADNVVEGKPSMGGEDFAYYCQCVPSCQCDLGCREEGSQEYPPLHHPKHDFNDKTLATAIELFCQVALRSGELDID